ncbi:uncharacterized protein CLUP02_10507 [Colletotrichum lupini]|uniref:Uncharacterized protein n=1 Tax=Colletotrichum lupini TaxID=145971 RepID=A0A9Q8WIY6_9PEZI|nr:uncharacterized protein CLUP02_10507 [Colletotrichum lupini]UQC85011.1 hypothetical protein CLUP02_10507 [Colletotrichum lupini]
MAVECSTKHPDAPRLPARCMSDNGGDAISWSLTTILDSHRATNRRHLHFENKAEVIRVRLVEAQTWRADDEFMASPRCNGDRRRWAMSGTDLYSRVRMLLNFVRDVTFCASSTSRRRGQEETQQVHVFGQGASDGGCHAEQQARVGETLDLVIESNLGDLPAGMQLAPIGFRPGSTNVYDKGYVHHQRAVSAFQRAITNSVAGRSNRNSSRKESQDEVTKWRGLLNFACLMFRPALRT